MEHENELEFHERLSQQVDHLCRSLIDARGELTGENRRVLSVQAGRALLLLGASLVGCGLGISAPAAPIQRQRSAVMAARVRKA